MQIRVDLWYPSGKLEKSNLLEMLYFKGLDEMKILLDIDEFFYA